MSRPAVDYEVPGRADDRADVVASPRDLLSSAVHIVTTGGSALWLGSLAHTLLTVATLFANFPKAISNVAVEAAPVVFRATERVGLVVAAITLAAAVLWNRRSPGRARRWVAWLLAGAATLAVAQTTIVSAKMDRLRAEGQSGGDTFRSLHGVSSSQYLVQTTLLLVACGLLPAALRSPLPTGRGLG